MTPLYFWNQGFVTQRYGTSKTREFFAFSKCVTPLYRRISLCVEGIVAWEILASGFCMESHKYDPSFCDLDGFRFFMFNFGHMKEIVLFLRPPEFYGQDFIPGMECMELGNTRTCGGVISSISISHAYVHIHKVES